MSLYRTKVALSIKGTRHERNAEVEVSPQDVAHIDPADLDLVGAAPEVTEEAPADVPLEDMTLAQLKERAKGLGLAATGSKADIQERITLHLSAGA